MYRELLKTKLISILADIDTNKSVVLNIERFLINYSPNELEPYKEPVKEAYDCLYRMRNCLDSLTAKYLYIQNKVFRNNFVRFVYYFNPKMYILLLNKAQELIDENKNLTSEIERSEKYLSLLKSVPFVVERRLDVVGRTAKQAIGQIEALRAIHVQVMNFDQVAADVQTLMTRLKTAPGSERGHIEDYLLTALNKEATVQIWRTLNEVETPLRRHVRQLNIWQSQRERLGHLLVASNDKLATVSEQIQTLTGAKLYPIIWQQSLRDFGRLSEWRATISEVGTEEAAIQLEQQLEMALHLEQELSALHERIQILKGQREEYIDLLQQNHHEFMSASVWIEKAHNLQERAMRYGEQPWGEGDNIATLWQDAQILAERQSRVVPNHLDEEMAEEALSQRLDELRLVVRDHEIFKARLQHVEITLVKLNTQEQRNKQETGELLKSIAVLIEEIRTVIQTTSSMNNHPIVWKESDSVLHNIQSMWFEYSQNMLEETPMQIEERLTQIRELNKETQMLLEHIKIVCQCRQEFIEFLAQRRQELIVAPAWIERARNLQERAVRYGEQPWSETDNIATLWQDAQILAERQGWVVPNHLDEGMAEKAFSQRLDELRLVVRDRETFKARLHRIETTLTKLREQEHKNQQELTAILQSSRAAIDMAVAKMLQLANMEECPIIWQPTEALRQQAVHLQENIGSPDTQRTPQELYEHVALSQQLQQHMMEVTKRVHQLIRVREQFVATLKNEMQVLVEMPVHTERTTDLIKRIAPYNPKNWEDQEAVDMLASDWKKLFDRQRRLVAGKLYDALPEQQLELALEELRLHIREREAFSARMMRIERQLDRLRLMEENARNVLRSTMSLIASLKFSYKDLPSPATAQTAFGLIQEILSLQQKCHTIMQELDARSSGLLVQKLDLANSISRQYQLTVEKLKDQLWNDIEEYSGKIANSLNHLYTTHVLDVNSQYSHEIDRILRIARNIRRRNLRELNIDKIENYITVILDIRRDIDKSSTEIDQFLSIAKNLSNARSQINTVHQMLYHRLQGHTWPPVSYDITAVSNRLRRVDNDMNDLRRLSDAQSSITTARGLLRDYEDILDSLSQAKYMIDTQARAFQDRETRVRDLINKLGLQLIVTNDQDLKYSLGERMNDINARLNALEGLKSQQKVAYETANTLLEEAWNLAYIMPVMIRKGDAIQKIIVGDIFAGSSVSFQQTFNQDLSI